jgi:hypothetical protein
METEAEVTITRPSREIASTKAMVTVSMCTILPRPLERA